MIERLFKFSPLQYSEGVVSIQLLPALLVLAGLTAVVAFLVFRSDAPPRVRMVSLGLRLLAAALLAWPLFEPALVTPTVVPNENFVAVLVDVSGSMSVADAPGGVTRLAQAQAVLHADGAGIMAAMEEDFQVRLYAFDDRARRLDSLPAVARGTGTDISAGLDRVMSDFRGLPLTGIVLFTDGADNTAQAPIAKAEELRALGIGLHVIGLGQESFASEREVMDVMVSKGVGKRAGAEIDVKVRSWGPESDPVTLSIYAGDVLVFSEEQTLKGAGKIDQISLFFEPPMDGAHAYRLAIEEAPGEINTANNALSMLVDARTDTLRVLYFEGHLRQDFKFIKRALEDDQVVDFTSIARTGTGKLYRQGIRSPDELAGGFPSDPGDLYAFDALIFGDVEASAFSPSQLRLIESFVRVRGGGFLMMGGRQTFAEGVYVTSPIADMLPVYLDASRVQIVPERFTDPRTASEEPEGFAFEPTEAGLESPILKLSPEPLINRGLWSGMPLLTSINYLGAPKAGAQVLARKPLDQYGKAEPLLIVQRYGKGRAAALATSSTWRWQMLLDASDYRHERFWQQLARWLAASAPAPVDIDVGQGHIGVGKEALLRVNLYDQEYDALEGAAVEGLLVGPDGGAMPLRFDEELAHAGTYTARFAPEVEGLYALDVTASRDNAVIGHGQRSVLARPDHSEFYDATLKRAMLERLAEAAGYYYTPIEAGDVVTNLRGRRTSTSVFHAEYLWDMPALFILAILLLCAEWMYRRRQGLP